MSNAVARAIVRHDYDPEMRVVVRSRIGYRAEDGNAWKGPWRTTFAAASTDAREHNLQTRLPQPPS